jgi:hypothetical protein
MFSATGNSAALMYKCPDLSGSSAVQIRRSDMKNEIAFSVPMQAVLVTG